MSQSRLPISALEHNVIHEFERRAKANAHDLKSSVTSGKVVPTLELMLDKIPPRGPCANLETREITIYESHLAYLWAFVYSSFVLFEEGIQKPMLAGAFNGRLELNNPLLQRAAALQNWAIKFVRCYSEWSVDELPNPAKVESASEKFYVPKVNNLFLQAVNFLLFHEYGHLVLGHCADGGRDWTLAQEQDADNYATTFFIEPGTPEKERQVVGISIVLLLASCVFIPERISGLWQVKHPHLHDRIRNGISSLNLESEESKFYIYYLASVALQTYLLEKGVDCPQLEIETAEELFFEYLARIDELRESGI
jgi:Peptidase U49